MAKYRTVQVELWDDPWIEELEPLHKLLYLYLFTNKHVNNLGVLEVSHKKIAFETGLTVQHVGELLLFFENAKKVVITPKYIWVVKFIKHQANTSPKIIASLGKQLQEVEDLDLVTTIRAEYHTLSIPYGYPIDTPPGKGIGKGIGKGREESVSDTGARIYGCDDDGAQDPEVSTQKDELPAEPAPKKTPYPSKRRPSRQTFMACLQIFQTNNGRANEDEAWCAWCDMEDRGMLADDAPYIRDRLIELFQEDDDWQNGFGPSFTKCIRTRAWRNQPFKRPNSPGEGDGQRNGIGSPPRANTEAQRVSQSHSNMAKALNRFKQGGQNADQHPGQPGQTGQGHHPVDSHGACLDLPGGETG